jgi:SNF family Na+-dependent transporter
MKNLHTKSFALVIFAVFAVCCCVVASSSGKSLTDLWSALVVAYKTVPLVLILAAFFVGYAWRWKIFRSWLVPFPDLNGTWQGVIQTTWKHPETGAIPAPIPVILTIKQSFTRIILVRVQV